MIVKLTLKFETEELIMLFGNSYKNWDAQFREYCRLHKPLSILSAETSKEEWIGWGSLKWCPDDDFQNELNREGCQQNEPDNPKPRKYQYFRFNDNKIVFNQCNKFISEINR